jgi:hypothetical protein
LYRISSGPADWSDQNLLEMVMMGAQSLGSSAISKGSGICNVFHGGEKTENVYRDHFMKIFKKKANHLKK